MPVLTPVTWPLPDRASAGRWLAERLAGTGSAGLPRQVVALPRGGVPVAAAIAAALGVDLQVLVVRKLGAPGQPELALAALAEGDPPVRVWEPAVRAGLVLDPAWLAEQTRAAQHEIERRVQDYRGGQPIVGLTGAEVILVDDGIATGATVRAARQALASFRPARVVLAVPVAPAELMARLEREFDAVYCLAQPTPFGSVGAHYQHFPQLTDDQVKHLLTAHAACRTSARPP